MATESGDFTIRQLDIFVTLARVGHFGRTAQQLGISQPAVSRCIATLEARLGRRLFVRRCGATPRLTPDGQALLVKAQAMLSARAAIRADGRDGEGQKHRVRLCIGPLLRDRYLKPLLPRLYRDHPEIEIELVPVIPLADVAAALDKGQADLVVYTVGRPVEGWPNVRRIGTIPTTMIGPPGMAARIAAGEARIAELPFILPATANLSEHWIERQLRGLGFELRQSIVYLDFPDVIQEMVADGQGVSVLMEEQVLDSLASGRLERIGPDFPPMQRIIARSPQGGRAARIVEEALAAALGEAEARSIASEALP
jgi:DNA-binding transcriptional LysR family regulator